MARPYRMDLVRITITPLRRGAVLIDPDFREPIGDDVEGEPITFRAQVSTAGNEFHPKSPSRQGDTEPAGGHFVYRLSDSARDNIKFFVGQDNAYLGDGSRVIRKGDLITAVEYEIDKPMAVRWEITGCRPRAILGPLRRRRSLLVHVDWEDKAEERGEVPT